MVPSIEETGLGFRSVGNAPTVEDFGVDYATPDGTAVRDYIHVTDLADAHVAALRYLIDGGVTTQFNLGTGHGLSVRKIIASVEAILGRRVPWQEAPRRAGDPPELIANAGRAIRDLGWRPEESSAEQIIASACRWHQSRLNVVPLSAGKLV